MLAVHMALLREFNGLEKRVRAMSRFGCQGPAVDVDAGCRAGHVADLCQRHR